jgi:hypothetical protein
MQNRSLGEPSASVPASTGLWSGMPQLPQKGISRPLQRWRGRSCWRTKPSARSGGISNIRDIIAPPRAAIVSIVASGSVKAPF